MTTLKTAQLLKQTDTMNAQHTAFPWILEGREIRESFHATGIAIFRIEDDARFAFAACNNYDRVLALNRELRGVCDYVLKNNSASLTSGTKEKLRIVLSKAEKESL